MKRWVLLIQTVAYMLLSVNSFWLKAQDVKSLIENFTYRSQFRFSFSPVLYDNLEFKNHGEKLINSHPTFSGESTVLYYQHIKKGYGINIGTGLGLAPFNLNYYFKAPDNSIFRTGIYKDDYEYLDLNHYEYYSMVYVFPIYLTKEFQFKNSLFLIGFGAKYHLLLDNVYEISGESIYYIDEANTYVKLFEFYLEDTGKKHILSYIIKLGLTKLTKKHNSYHFNLVVNYSPNKIGKGWYKFYNLGYDSYGTVEQNINYIGFEFVYGLTLSKRVENEK